MHMRIPMRPPGTAYSRGHCSALSEMTRENSGVHENFPCASFDTMPGRICHHVTFTEYAIHEYCTRMPLSLSPSLLTLQPAATTYEYKYPIKKYECAQESRSRRLKSLTAIYALQKRARKKAMCVEFGTERGTHFNLLTDMQNALQETAAGHASFQVVQLAARLVHVERPNHCMHAKPM